MANKSLVNPTDGQMISRHLGRIETLKLAIEKSKKSGNDEKVNSLQSELSRRLEAVRAFRDSLNGV